MMINDTGPAKYKEGLGLNDPVAVTLPASVWLTFYAAYLSTPWAAEGASRIADAIEEEMLDPLYRKEAQARAQKHVDEQEGTLGAVRRMVTGQFPQFPEPPPGMMDGL